MLQAMLKNGKLVTLAHFPRKDIERFRKEHEFYCPSCHSEVLIKAGHKIIPHFAHKNTGRCPRTFGEGPEHELGKHLLYDWLRNQALPTKLEKYLPDIEQIPDLFLSIQDKFLAIEYQRASLSRREFLHRTMGFQKSSITPLWILGENQYDKQSNNSIKLTNQLKQFLHKFSSTCRSSLYFFCPHTKGFIFVQDLHFTSNYRAIGSFQFIPLHKASFKHFFQYKVINKSRLYNSFLREKINFRTKARGRAYGMQGKWLQWLYVRRMHWETLPSAVYLPVKNQIQMTSPPWDWQSRLVLDIIEPLEAGEKFAVGECFHRLKNHLLPKDYYPLYSLNIHPIREYLGLLEKLQVIKGVSENYFVKLKSIEFNKNIEDAIMNDKLLIHNLM